MKKENKFIKLIDYIVPRYAYLPLAIVLLANVIAYYGTRLFSDCLTYYSPALPIDDHIPFIPAFISIYILSYAQWVLSYILIARENREVCNRIIYGATCAKLICMVIFLVYPTYMERPEVVGDGLWNTLVRFIYSADTSDHLFPSIHCLESWICFRASLVMRKPAPIYKLVSFVSALLVFASTVFVKQHCFIDIIGGVVVAELGLLIWGIIGSKIKNKKGTVGIEST